MEYAMGERKRNKRAEEGKTLKQLTERVRIYERPEGRMIEGRKEGTSYDSPNNENGTV